jgi:hypothetical protein
VEGGEEVCLMGEGREKRLGRGRWGGGWRRQKRPEEWEDEGKQRHKVWSVERRLFSKEASKLFKILILKLGFGKNGLSMDTLQEVSAYPVPSPTLAPLQLSKSFLTPTHHVHVSSDGRLWVAGQGEGGQLGQGDRASAKNVARQVWR